jgi:hypothetical protein
MFKENGYFGKLFTNSSYKETKLDAPFEISLKKKDFIEIKTENLY